MKRLCILKKLMALIVSIGMVGSLCACSDQSWSVKYGDITMTMGEYVLFEYESYNEAMQKLGLTQQSTSKPVSKQKIGDQKASDWIKKETLDKCKMFLYVNSEFNARGLSITDDEKKEIDVAVDNYWGQVESTWEKRGVSKDSFYAVVGEYPKKLEKVFKSMYGKDGTNPVSDEDLEKYFRENYMALCVVQKSLLKASEDADNPTAS